MTSKKQSKIASSDWQFFRYSQTRIGANPRLVFSQSRIGLVDWLTIGILERGLQSWIGLHVKNNPGLAS